jgi:hypothetical protein
MSATITADLPCLACGYNLRTQSVAGVCPECTHPVAASLAGDQLGRADSRWLLRIQRGLLLESIASGLIILYALGQILDLTQVHGVSIALDLTLAVFAIVVFAAGVLLAAREPGRPRRGMRFTLFAGSFIFAGAMLIQAGFDFISEFRSSPQTGPWEMFWNDHMDWLMAAMPVRFVAQAILLAMLARRCRASHLRWQAILLGWIFTSSTAIATIGPCIAEQMPPAKARMRLESVVDFSEYVCIGLYLWVVVLLVLFFLRIRRERTSEIAET